MSLLLPRACCAANARKKLRPIRPKPLTPTRTVTCVVSLVADDLPVSRLVALVQTRRAQPAPPDFAQPSTGLEGGLRGADPAAETRIGYRHRDRDALVRDAGRDDFD